MQQKLESLSLFNEKARSIMKASSTAAALCQNLLEKPLNDIEEHISQVIKHNEDSVPNFDHVLQDTNDILNSLRSSDTVISEPLVDCERVLPVENSYIQTTVGLSDTNNNKNDSSNITITPSSADVEIPQIVVEPPGEEKKEDEGSYFISSLLDELECLVYNAEDNVTEASDKLQKIYVRLVFYL